MFRRVLVLVALICICNALPVKQIERDPEEEAGYFEGDMVLEPDQLANKRVSGINRNGLVSKEYRWPDKKVPYKISTDFDKEHRDHILTGLKQIEAVSCIRFIPAKEEHKEYVNVTAEAGGCYSYVGYRQRVQQLNLNPAPLDTGCFRLGTIMHEFIHALGFYHQQSTYDRDDYVTIVKENIKESSIHNFNIYNNTVVEDFGIEYDYGSVMHYGPFAFSMNGEQTIIPKDPTATIGQRRALSIKDIQKLNLMYRCPFYV